jgi:undecaprenyl diphosphate synthase
MDGNGRWAQNRGLPRLEGHRAGVERIEVLLETLSSFGVKFATIYAFSTENWGRPQDEVDGLIDIFSDAVDVQTRRLHDRNVRIVHLGKRANLDPELRRAVENAQNLTRDNTGITLNVAFDYGGRDEILDAVRRIIRDGLAAEQVDEATFCRYLFTAHCPDPDLIIRTGGEQRISNFLLWQSAYSEFYHTCTLWPDLQPQELEEALEAYRSRQRRYGKVAEPEP